MEQAVQAGYNFKGRDKPKPKLVRYADDLVVFFPTREGIEKAKAVLEAWLTDMGLEMKPSKTRIAHSPSLGWRTAWFRLPGLRGAAISRWQISFWQTQRKTTWLQNHHSAQ